VGFSHHRFFRLPGFRVCEVLFFLATFVPSYKSFKTEGGAKARLLFFFAPFFSTNPAPFSPPAKYLATPETRRPDPLVQKGLRCFRSRMFYPHSTQIQSILSTFFSGEIFSSLHSCSACAVDHLWVPIWGCLILTFFVKTFSSMFDSPSPALAILTHPLSFLLWLSNPSEHDPFPVLFICPGSARGRKLMFFYEILLLSLLPSLEHVAQIF